MPQNTQMHIQWITVNGQSVPLVLPQYWDGEKWVVSSEQNPLPVKAELTGSKVAHHTINLPTVEVSGDVQVLFQPPNGKRWDITSVSIDIRTRSTSGTYRCVFYKGAIRAENIVMDMTIPANQDIRVFNSIFNSEVINIGPITEIGQLITFSQISVTNDNPLIFRVTNFTDSAFDGTKLVKLFYEEVNL